VRLREGGDAGVPGTELVRGDLVDCGIVGWEALAGEAIDACCSDDREGNARPEISSAQVGA